MQKSLEEIFQENLRFYRQRAKLSQEKLSSLLDKNINYINMIESGKSVPPLSMIEQISSILKIEPHYFLKPAEENSAFDKNSFIENASLQIAEKAKSILTELLE